MYGSLPFESTIEQTTEMTPLANNSCYNDKTITACDSCYTSGYIKLNDIYKKKRKQPGENCSVSSGVIHGVVYEGPIIRVGTNETI